MTHITSPEKGCPEWCIEKHGNDNPMGDDGPREGPHDLEHIWDRGIGTGTCYVTTDRILDKGKLTYEIELEVSDILTPDELEAAAQQFERLAAEIRSWGA